MTSNSTVQWVERFSTASGCEDDRIINAVRLLQSAVGIFRFSRDACPVHDDSGA